MTEENKAEFRAVASLLLLMVLVHKHPPTTRLGRGSVDDVQREFADGAVTYVDALLERLAE